MSFATPHYYHHYGKKHTSSKKKLPALVVEIKEDTEGALPIYLIKILIQKYRGSEFNKRGDFHRFIATNNFALVSDGSPEVSENHSSKRRVGYTSRVNKFFVRGSSTYNDDRVVKAYSLSYITELKEAVKEYNEYVKS